MPLDIKQYLQVPTSTILKKGSTTSRMHLTFNSVVGTYYYLVPTGVGNKAR